MDTSPTSSPCASKKFRFSLSLKKKCDSSISAAPKNAEIVCRNANVRSNRCEFLPVSNIVHENGAFVNGTAELRQNVDCVINTEASSSIDTNTSEIPGIKLSTLSNLGNTCYLNSVVYALRFLDEFRKLLHETVQKLRPNMVSYSVFITFLRPTRELCVINKYFRSLIRNNSDSQATFLSSYTRYLETCCIELFKSLCQAEVTDMIISDDVITTDIQFSHHTPAICPVPHNSVKLLESLRVVNNIYEGFSQHDAHELLGFLLTCIENVTTTAPKRRSKKLATYSSVFGGLSILKTVCQECENYSEVEDIFWTISIPSSSFCQYDMSGDNDGDIPSTFKMEEIMRDDNKIWCDHCYQHNEAYRFCRYRRLPSLLIIQLKQSLNPRLTECIPQVPNKIILPHSIPCLLDECPKPCSLTEHRYELCSTICHTGLSLSSGHYSTYIKGTVKSAPTTKRQRFPKPELAASLRKSPRNHLLASAFNVTVTSKCPSRSNGTIRSNCCHPDIVHFASDQWLYFDDENVKIVDTLPVFHSGYSTQSPYMLFYKQASL